MAYVITIGQPFKDTDSGVAGMQVESRRAVTTLDEARETVATLSGRPSYTLDRVKFEAGGTIATLPDGTEIEVEFWGAVRAVNWMVAHDYDPQTESFIDAYNNEE
jgi:hypothetical protein